MISLVTLAMVCGGLAGLGLWVLLSGLLPAGPRLDAALQRLHAQQTAAADPTLGPTGRWIAARFGPRLRPPTRELRLIGKSNERYALEKIGLPLVGVLFVPVMTYLLSVIGLQLPIVVPVAGSLALAVVFFFLVDVMIKQQAAEARDEFIRAVAVYFDLVALERSAAHGPVESLERAAQVGDGWVFRRIQESLDAARFAGIPPWDGLSRVADEIGVPALGDVGDIMRLSGTEGAQVYQTLVSRAQSLRVQLRTKEHDRANTSTTLLYVPTSLTVLILFVLIGYPFLIRLVNP
ncbi:type II secretion system F family protein [Krasilnikovia sp. MM14-A1259]|uniref:type II secretion system F family protein n=1 Tax=Krasilnikovia sp. MM14-A1259 TaxID=3373539 RepID=UPI0037F69D3D